MSASPEESYRSPEFPSTRWSTVLSAASPDQPQFRDALSRLCESYWYPLYAYVRRRGYNLQQAQDLTQDFFSILLEKNYLKSVQRERGKFRSFLLAALNHFLANDWDRSRAQKRGGGKVFTLTDLHQAENRYQLEPAHDLTPERIFEKCWALSLLEKTIQLLQKDWEKQGNPDLFQKLKPFMLGEDESTTYREMAQELNMTEGAIKVAIHRMRRRFREFLCDEILDTLENPRDLDEEVRYFIHILSSPSTVSPKKTTG